MVFSKVTAWNIWLVVFILVLGTPLALLLDRREPVEVTNGTITPFFVRNGQVVVVTWVAKEGRVCDGEIRRIIVDSIGRIHDFAREPAVHRDITTAYSTRKFSRTFTMPLGMAPGPAIYYVVGYRWCNFFQEHIWPIYFRSEEIKFEVLTQEGERASGRTGFTIDAHREVRRSAQSR